MKPHEVIRLINEGWGFRLPGEPSLYWNPSEPSPGRGTSSSSRLGAAA
jgi:hypothetical protein